MFKGKNRLNKYLETKHNNKNKNKNNSNKPMSVNIVVILNIKIVIIMKKNNRKFIPLAQEENKYSAFSMDSPTSLTSQLWP